MPVQVFGGCHFRPVRRLQLRLTHPALRQVPTIPHFSHGKKLDILSPEFPEHP